MAFYSGSNGELLINGVRAARVRSWSVNSSVATLSATSLKDTDEVVTEGIRSTTGNCALWYYADNPVTKEGNSATVLLNALIKARTAGASEGVAAKSDRVTLRLKVDDLTTEGKFIEGEVILTSTAMAMAVGEVLSADVGFTFVGAPTGVHV